MRIQRHPRLVETMVQLKDGSAYTKRWLYYRVSLSLDVDTNTNPKWKKSYSKYQKYSLVKSKEPKLTT